MRRVRILLLAFAACAGLALAAPALAVQVSFKSAWMRPAEGGTTAKAYVDIFSDTPLTLIGASTPVAKKVQIVTVVRTDGNDPGKVVKSLPVAADKPTRLAYLGNHLRLVDLKQDVVNGSQVPVTLTFRDKAGRRHVATAEIGVRGLVMLHRPPVNDEVPPPMQPTSPMPSAPQAPDPPAPTIPMSNSPAPATSGEGAE
jgi:copper(I)-binding protein